MKCYYVKVSQIYVPKQNPKGQSVKNKLASPDVIQIGDDFIIMKNESVPIKN